MNKKYSVISFFIFLSIMSFYEKADVLTQAFKSGTKKVEKTGKQVGEDISKAFNWEINVKNETDGDIYTAILTVDEMDQFMIGANSALIAATLATLPVSPVVGTSGKILLTGVGSGAAGLEAGALGAEVGSRVGADVSLGVGTRAAAETGLSAATRTGVTRGVGEATTVGVSRGVGEATSVGVGRGIGVGTESATARVGTGVAERSAVGARGAETVATGARGTEIAPSAVKTLGGKPSLTERVELNLQKEYAKAYPKADYPYAKFAQENRAKELANLQFGSEATISTAGKQQSVVKPLSTAETSALKPTNYQPIPGRPISEPAPAPKEINFNKELNNRLMAEWDKTARGKTSFEDWVKQNKAFVGQQRSALEGEIAAQKGSAEIAETAASTASKAAETTPKSQYISRQADYIQTKQMEIYKKENPGIPFNEWLGKKEFPEMRTWIKDYNAQKAASEAAETTVETAPAPTGKITRATKIEPPTTTPAEAVARRPAPAKPSSGYVSEYDEWLRFVESKQRESYDSAKAANPKIKEPFEVWINKNPLKPEQNMAIKKEYAAQQATRETTEAIAGTARTQAPAKIETEILSEAKLPQSTLETAPEKAPIKPIAKKPATLPRPAQAPARTIAEPAPKPLTLKPTSASETKPLEIFDEEAAYSLSAKTSADEPAETLAPQVVKYDKPLPPKPGEVLGSPKPERPTRIDALSKIRARGSREVNPTPIRPRTTAITPEEAITVAPRTEIPAPPPLPEVIPAAPKPPVAVEAPPAPPVLELPKAPSGGGLGKITPEDLRAARELKPVGQRAPGAAKPAPEAKETFASIMSKRRAAFEDDVDEPVEAAL